MGNDNAKEKEKGGYSLQGASNSGPSGHVDSEQERQARAAAAEARANKAKPKKVQAGVRAAHFDRYEEIERQAQNRGGGADRKTPRGPDPIKCPACTFTATDESTIASHIETSHPVDPNAREARLKATENRLNSKPSSPSSSSRPSSSSPSNSASPDTGISCPMCGRSNFQSEAAVDVHIERDHGATASERDQRAKIVEERLKKSQRGGAAKQQQRKDENWQKYASMGGAVETDNKPENKTNEELARELDVEQAIKRFSSHIGRPEIVQASAKFISNILSKVANPPEPDQAEKYRKVNISNEKVREKIINVEGALEVLESIGFKIVTLPSASGNPEDYLLIQEPNKSLVEFAVQKLSGLSGQ